MRQGFLGFADDGYGTGERSRRQRQGVFAGRAAAYFDISRIEEFAKAISEYPIPERRRCSLASGFGPRVPEPLHQEHLNVGVYPIDSRGYIGVQARMATPVWNEERADSQKTAKLDLLTTYEPLARFSRDLLALIRGAAEEAVLEAEMIP